ncbi:Oxysterol-binding protein OBPa [Elasticomyces elasticus]|nr:Oxysterol-binding protein OBPa [Elasticomyces elasticus]
MYARGILFGKMKYELGDHASVKCPETGLEVDIEFKVKGWMGGTYNAIGGFIKDTKSGKNLFELSGFWNAEMMIKNLTTGKKQTLFDATHARETPPKARPLSEQSDRESQKLWAKVTQAIKVADQRTATDEKTRIEDMQRDEASQRGEQEWHAKLFRRVRPGGSGPGDREGEENLDWVINATIDGKTPQEITQQILAIAPILPGQQYGSSNQQLDAMPPADPPARAQQEAPSSSVSSIRQQPEATSSSFSSTPHQQLPLQQSDDLIDFRQNDVPRGKPRAGGPFGGDGSGVGSLQSSLSSGKQPSLTRQDSLEGVEEEFVDAES